MNAKSFLTVAVSSVLIAFSVISTSFADVITFDDISPNEDAKRLAVITNGYSSLNWVNFDIVDAPLTASLFVTNGSYYGMESASNVAFNVSGLPAEIAARGTNFNFRSAYLTGMWSSNLNIEVQGFRGGSLVYDTSVIAGATNATLFTFDYADIDRLYFNPFGGQDAGFPTGDGGGGTWFAMDNFTFEFVPEPSSLLLATLGALALCPFLKRRHA